MLQIGLLPLPVGLGLGRPSSSALARMRWASRRALVTTSSADTPSRSVSGPRRDGRADNRSQTENDPEDRQPDDGDGVQGRPLSRSENERADPYPDIRSVLLLRRKLTNEAGKSPVGSLAPSIHVFFRLQFKVVFV